jgi:transcriptional regulator
MYIPKFNEEMRTPVLREFIRAHSFGVLVTMGNELMASHLPMVLEDDGTEFGVLRAHVSRANTQWRDTNTSVEVLAIFSGDHHYISPNWYPSKHEDGRQVPTWNYVVAHAYGTLRVVEDPQWLTAHLESLTNIHEAPSPAPWKVTDAPADFLQKMLKGIVGLELPIRRLEGKWKLSQNRSDRDRAGVIEGLDALDTAASLAMKQRMQGR